MLRTWRTLYLLSLSLMVGGMVFLSFLVAPVLFQNFPREQAGETLSVIFPGYHLWAISLALLALASFFFMAIIHSKWSLTRFILLTTMVVLSLYAGMVTGPDAAELRIQIQEQKEEQVKSPELREKFHKLHQRAVILNGVVLLIGIGLLLDLGVRAKH